MDEQHLDPENLNASLPAILEGIQKNFTQKEEFSQLKGQVMNLNENIIELKNSNLELLNHVRENQQQQQQQQGGKRGKKKLKQQKTEERQRLHVCFFN